MAEAPVDLHGPRKTRDPINYQDGNVRITSDKDDPEKLTMSYKAPPDVVKVKTDVYCDKTLKASLDLTLRDGLWISPLFDRCPPRANIDFEIFASQVPERATINPREGFVERPVDQPLIVNTSTPHYYSKRTRRQGELDLKILVADPKSKEEFFVFIEGIDKDNKPISYWYEVGEKETEKRVIHSHSNIFIAAIQSDFQKVTGMSLYHFHPTAPKDSKELGKEYPSSEDLTSLFSLILGDATDSFGYPYNVLDYRVINPFGAFVMKPARNMILANASTLEEQRDRYQKFWDSFTIVYSRGSLEGLSWAEICRRFALGASSELVEFSFLPLE